MRKYHAPILFFAIVVLFHILPLGTSAQANSNPFGYSVQPDLTSASTYSVGSVSGEFQVSGMGEANYSMAIEVPGGINGMEPKIAIVYGSQSGNGVVGCGFQLSCSSAITRSPRDIWHDGKASGITHDSDDALFLDGQRLVAVQHTDGCDSAVYCPEFSPYTSVTVHGLNASSQTGIWFSVHTTDGRTHEYGRDGAQQTYTLNSQQKVNAWYLNKTTDAVGNNMTYSYITDENCVYLSSIQYGGNSVEFVYDATDRPDIIEASIEGVKVKMKKRLAAIKSYIGNTRYRCYTFDYADNGDQTQTKFSRLQSVRMYNAYDNSGVDEVPPTQFEWDHLPSYSCQKKTPSLDIDILDWNAPWDAVSLYAADLNGDGLTDLATMVNGSYQNTSNRVRIRYASLDNANNVCFGNSVVINAGSQMDIPGVWTHRVNSPVAMDMDGDGVNELLVPMFFSSPESKYCGFYVYKGNSCIGGVRYTGMLASSPDEVLTCAGDFNNDGRGEIVVLDKTNTLNNGIYFGTLMGGYTQADAFNKTFAFYAPSEPKRMFAADLNLDGMTDVIVFYNGGYAVYLNNGTWLDSTTTQIYPTLSSGTLKLNAMTLYPGDVWQGDFNGDGISDFLIRNAFSYSFYYALGKGNSQLSVSNAFAIGTPGAYVDWAENDEFHCNVIDFNGDGKSDVIINHRLSDSNQSNQAFTYWLRSNGTQLVQQSVSSSLNPQDGQGKNYVTGDFNGDGIQELASFSYDCYNSVATLQYPAFRIYQNRDYHIGTGRVKRITDGYGNQTQISYKPFTDPSVYTKATDAVFPVITATLPLSCVASTNEGNGAAGSISKTYAYHGLKVHVQGRGSLGMSKTVVVNNTTGLTTTDSVGMRDAHTLLPLASIQKYKLGTQLRRQETDYYLDSTFHAGAFCYMPDVVKNWDFDGKWIEQSSTFSPDSGLVTSTTRYGDDNNYETTFFENYVYAGGRYQPTRIRKRKWHIHASEPAEQLVTFEYDQRGLVKKKTDATNSSRPVSTSYNYDAYGNLLADTTRATLVEAVVNTYEYDDSHRHVTRSVERGYIVKEYQYQWDKPFITIDKTRSHYPQQTTTVHDSWGNLLSEVSPENLTTTYTRGWGSTQAMKYFIVEQGTARPWVKTWYDSRGREVLVETIGASDLSITQATSYDSYGRVASKTSTTGNLSVTETFAYDQRDRITSSTVTSSQGESHQTTYSYDSNRTVTTTEAGLSTARKYDSFGNLLTVTTPASTVTYTYNSMHKPVSVSSCGSTVTMQYDKRGNRTKIIDPDAGTITNTYDAYDRIKSEKDARGNTITYLYDYKGRLKSIWQTDSMVSYTYGTTSYNNGLLTQVVRNQNSINYTYDQYGRVTQELYNTELGTRSISHNYDVNGLPCMTCYPDNVCVSSQFDCYGNKTSTSVGGRTVWQLGSQTGSTVQSALAGGMQMIRSYNGNGQLTSQTLQRNGSPLRTMTFTYDDQTHNLTARSGVMDSTETFSYDIYDRLTNATAGIDNTHIEYAPNGNILSKTGYGQYHYGNSRPHAITGIDNAMGIIPTDRLDTQFNPYGKVSRIYDHGTGNALSISYGPDEERWITKQTRNDTLLRTNLYLGDYEESVSGGVTQRTYYLDGNALLVKKSNGTERLYYMLTDHQGTIVALVDTLGVTRYRACFDAWGNRTSVVDNTGISLYFQRGYTGHEMLPEFGLINMNGRMYDPLLGRFLSPDRYVQLPDNSQNFNRYSYCLNNPLKYTDPSGELIGVDDAIAIIAVGAIIGGTFNVISNSENIHGFGDFISYFGVGALAGGAGAAVGLVSFGVGGFIGGAISGMASGSVSGFILGGGNSYLQYGNFSHFWDDAAHDAFIGAASGAVIGGVIGGISAHRSGYDFWTGKTTTEPGFGTPRVEEVSHPNSVNSESNVTTNSNKIDIKGQNDKPIQKHHFATNKNKRYTPEMRKIVEKYDLDLNGDWNIESMRHQGRHPKIYHEWVLRNMRIIDNMPNMNQQQFIIQFELRIKQPVIQNPDMLYRKYWINR